MKKNKKNKKWFLIGLFILGFFFLGKNVSASVIQVNNGPCNGTVTINLNKTTYAPGENVVVSGNMSISCISPANFLDGYITASDSYMGTYRPVSATFKAPNYSGPFTIYVKYGYNAYGAPPGSGETQTMANVEIQQYMSVTMTATPNPVPYGDTANIKWTSAGASSCTSNVGGGLAGTASGPLGYTTSPIIKDTKFELYCIGPNPSGGTRTARGEVTVIVLKTTTTPGPITDVLTGNATEVLDTTAVLNGSLNPGGDASVSGYFRYSKVEGFPPVFCNDIYGSNMRSTREVLLGGASKSKTFSTKITGLTPNSTYYYCAIGSADSQISDTGDVRSFTTKTDRFSVDTKNATVASETSAYLNGFFNTAVSAKTYFEYRKAGFDNSSNKQSSVFELIKNKLSNLLKIKKALASTSILKNKPSTYSWVKIGEETQSANRNGNFSFLLTGLSPSTMYEFRAVIKADSALNVVSDTVYGNISSFKTREASNTYSGEVPGGGSYTDPCQNTDDINCNGTGGNGSGYSYGDNSLPDLTASNVSPTNIIVNVPTPLIANIKNLGGNSTGKKFFGFFQISTINRENNSDKTNNNGAVPTGGTLSKFEKILKTEKAYAANIVTGGGTATIDNTLINLPAISIPTLSGRSSTQIKNIYTFTSKGTYYARACADKSSIMNAGLITETYENNNCGAWTKILVGTESISNDWNWNGNGGNSGSGNGSGNGTLTLGQIATPPNDAIVRYHEGIEHVFVRQIKTNTELAKMYGYKDGNNLDTFAWDLADQLARIFGYVSSNGKEIRVSLPDIAAYELRLEGSKITVYEYFDSKIVNIQSTTELLRNIYDYEYYFNKK